MSSEKYRSEVIRGAIGMSPAGHRTKPEFVRDSVDKGEGKILNMLSVRPFDNLIDDGGDVVVHLILMEFWISQTFNGVSYGALLFLFASGLSLIFGVMRIVNLAHGSYYLLAGYIGISMMRFKNSYALGVLAGAVGIALVGIFMVRIFLRRVSGNDLGQVLITMGFALVFQDVALLIWGGDPFTIQVPKALSGSMAVGPLHFPRYRVFILFVAVLIGFGLWLFHNRTRAGAMIRAAIDHEEMARGMGINVPLISMGVYGLGAFLAGVAGVVGGGFLTIYPGIDFEMLPYAFVVVILGGRGSLEGAMIGSLAVGLIDNFGKVLFPELSYFTLFAPMVLMLAIRPMGLFGKA
jgi:branched-chain amino acid transport system permease protein